MKRKAIKKMMRNLMLDLVIVFSMLGTMCSANEFSKIIMNEEKGEIVSITSEGVRSLSANYNAECSMEVKKPKKEKSMLEVDKSMYEYDIHTTGYAKYDNIPIYIAPSEDAEIFGYIQWNDIVYYGKYNDNFVIVNVEDGEHAWVKKSDVIDSPYGSTKLSVSGDKRKSYMDYTCITARGSMQYKLQAYAYTEINGVRAVNGRYCIALGKYYTHQVGQYVDIVLSNGVVIPCIVGDCKKNQDTVNNNSVGADGSVAEFVVQTSSLSKSTRNHGDVSYASEGWLSNASEIIIYDYNFLSDAEH